MNAHCRSNDPRLQDSPPASWYEPPDELEDEPEEEDGEEPDPFEPETWHDD